MSHLIAPLLLGGVFALISVAVRRTRREHTDSVEIYRYPALVGYLMVACALLFAGAFTLQVLTPGPRADSPAMAFLVWSALTLSATGAATYFLRYRVMVGDGVLRWGIFRIQCVPLADIIDLDATPGDKGYLYVYLKDGGRVHFSGMLGDIAGLAATLNGYLPAGAQPCPRRLRDRRNRVLYLWVLLGSILVIGAAAFLWVRYG